MKLMIILSLLSLLISGCSGTGFNKRATLMPDEVWIAGDVNPVGTDRNWKACEITGGAKWRLK